MPPDKETPCPCRYYAEFGIKLTEVRNFLIHWHLNVINMGK